MDRVKAMTTALLAASVAMGPLTAWPQPLQDRPVETITIRLSSFAFNPEQLRLRVGVPVRLHLENVSGGGHNFSSPALFAASTFQEGPPPRNGKIEVAGSSSLDIVLTPRAPGTYKFECTHFLHSLFGMTGTIVVTGP
jgi:plastocyanin